jgi:hypothetical protein
MFASDIDGRLYKSDGGECTTELVYLIIISNVSLGARMINSPSISTPSTRLLPRKGTSLATYSKSIPQNLLVFGLTASRFHPSNLTSLFLQYGSCGLSSEGDDAR